MRDLSLTIRLPGRPFILREGFPPPSPPSAPTSTKCCIRFACVGLLPLLFGSVLGGARVSATNGTRERHLALPLVAIFAVYKVRLCLCLLVLVLVCSCALVCSLVLRIYFVVLRVGLRFLLLLY